jgi:hypothetical protein
MSHHTILSCSTRTWEEVINEAQEEGNILRNVLAHVHVAQGAHQQVHLQQGTMAV